MKSQEYVATQQIIIGIGRNLSMLDLKTFLEQISRAESMAPILDPTLFRRAQDNLTAVRKLAESLLPVQKAFEELQGVVLRTGSTAYMEKIHNDKEKST